MSRKVAIIGSGFLGLTLASRFADLGCEVKLFEAAPEIGGLASAWNIGDIVWDKHYHVTLLSDSYTRGMARELGLEEEYEWVGTKTGFYAGGKLYSMSDSFEFLKFPLLGLIGKLRLGATIFYASRIRDWKSLEKVTVEEWLTKFSGRKTFEKIWLPLLKAKLGDAYKRTSAAFIWATIQRMYAARKSGLKTEMFGYMKGGYSRILSRYEEVLREKGVEIRLSSQVETVSRSPKGIFSVVLARNASRSATSAPDPALAGSLADQGQIGKEKLGEETEDRFDTVVITSPATVASSIAVQLSEEEKERLRRVKYQGIVCASVLTKKPISDFYVTNIIDETPFTGIIEMSAMVDREEFGGWSLIYLPKYLSPDDPLFEKPDEEIEELFLSELDAMYENFSRSDVLAFKVSKVRQVFPLPVLRYSEKLPTMKTSNDGLYIVNSSHIVNGTLNVNETVRLAESFFSEFFGNGGSKEV